MRAAGYDTALIGKCHLQSISGAPPTIGMPVPDPSKIQPPKVLREAQREGAHQGRYDQELRSTWVADPNFELELPYYGFDHVELAVGHGDAVVGHYERWLKERCPDAESLPGPERQLPGNDYSAPQAWRTRVPAELYPTSFVAERTMAYLEAHAGDAGAPFFLQCSFPDPHHPFTPPGKYWDMYDPEDVSLPASFILPDERLTPTLRELYAERDSGKANREGQRTFAVTDREAREAIALTYGMITMVDDAIGMVLARLRELRLSDNTVVVFNSDHGDFMGDHQLLLKGALHYQGLIRVPFIWADPAGRDHGLVNSDLAGTLDVAQTILDRANLEGHNGIQGKSLLRAVSGGPTGHESMVVEEHQRRGYMGFGDNFRARSLITKRHRLTVYDGSDWGELYDLESDPLESQNLWDDPQSREIRQELVERLLREMISLSDSSPLATHHGP